MDNLISATFDMLTVVDISNDKDKWGHKLYNCKCDCGNMVQQTKTRLSQKGRHSCGCHKNDIKGNRYGRLVVIDKAESKGSDTRFVCQCDCGNIKTIYRTSLISGRTRSCGCLYSDSETANKKRESLGKYLIGGTYTPNLNDKIQKRNKSGYKGVCWKKNENKWEAYITFKKHRYHLGVFSNVEDAAEVRKEAEKHLFGEFLKWYNNRP